MQFDEETKLVLNTLNKFGSLTIDQIKKIFEGTGFNPKPMIAFMCNTRLIQFTEDNYAVLQNQPIYKPETLYCEWVMIDKIRHSGADMIRTMKTASPCDNGAEVCFINNAQTIEYLTFINKLNIARVSMLQDTFYTETGIPFGKEST